ncbi:MAG TPA: UDP-glucose/GDP-mannose dehydrogenase family protein [Pyrinomonadaceae bacterium]|nr:UDP-glucose/GDP-mannose dehydrogenase family protein [Pyrinomonadaceae bacterium]
MPLRISIFGLGYVGCVSAACFAKAGHHVIGVDVNPTKVEIINSGKSPIVEQGMNELLAGVVKEGRLVTTTDPERGITESDLSLICVGTPSNPNGSLDLSHVKHVCSEIGSALKKKKTRHIVVIRSTVLPGTVHNTVIAALEEASGKKAGKDFGIAINPEFLREGSSLKDFYAPPFTLIGADDEATAAVVRELYADVNAPVFVTALKTAEMIKYVCNCFHALKVTFANEIGNICKAAGVDSHEVMDIFCQDTKLNLSSYYLKPGFAFGGSCLPKDLRAINYKAKELDVEVPVLSSILPSNRLQIEKAIDLALRTGKKRVGVLGFSFKAGTDDLRESPMVTLIETLIGKGLQLAIYDRDVSLARLFGANKEYIEREIPHVAQLMRGSMEEVLAESEVLIVGHPAEEFRGIESRLKDGQLVIDLVRILSTPTNNDSYQGICW